MNSINDPPVITELPAQATDEEVALVLPFVVGDVETPGNALILQATSSDTNLVPNASLVLGGSDTNRTLTITPALNQHGTAILTVAVQDESGARVETSFPLTVRPVNDPPTLDAIADLALLEDAPAQTVNLAHISSGASDEIQSLIVTATNPNPSLLTNLLVTYLTPSANGSIQFVPVPHAYGSAVITVTVNDTGASNNIIQRSFTVNVRSINDPPTISDVTDHTINEDGAVGPLAVTVGDVETPASALMLTATSSDPTLVNSDSVVFGGSGADRTVTITPLPNRSGKATVTLTVTDADFGTASDSFELIVLPINDAPTISDVSNQSVAEDGTLANVAFTVGDAESPAAQLLVLAASSNPALLPPTGLVLGGSGTNHTVSLTPAANQSGSATVTLTVVDPDGLSASDSFVLTVSAVNDPPVVSSISAQTILEDTATGPLTWMVDDPETPASALTVTASSSNPSLVSPANVVPSGTGINRTVVVTPLANQFGTATITLTVTDGGGATTNSSFLLTVTAVNDSPTLNPLTNLTLTANAGLQTVPLSGLGVGAANESQSLTLTATSSQPGLIPHPTVNYTPGSTTGTLTFTPVAGASGVATVTVIANDGGGGSSTVTRTFTVTVTAVSGPPSISNVPNQTTLEDTPIAVPFTVSDTETDPLRLTVTFGSSNPALVPTANITLHGAGSERLVLLKPNPDLWGATTITLTVSDGTGTASDTFVLTVVPVNDPPTLDSLADLSRSQGFGNFTVGLLGVGSGATNELQTCTITAASSDPSLVVVGTLNYTPGATSGSVQLKKGATLTGAARISVTVNDGGTSNNNITTRSFMVYVKPTANLAPTISALTARTIQEDTSTGPVAFTIGDSQTPADQLILTAESLDPVLFPPANVVLGGTGTSRTITVTPAPNQYGSNNIKISLRDSAYGFLYVNYPITVTPVNDAPTISVINNQTNTSGTPTGLIPFVVNDPETAAGSLAVSATSANQTLVPNANILLGGSGTNWALRLTSVAGQVGNATIVTARDASLTSTQTFVLAVTAANTPPTLSDIADQITPDGTPTSALPFTVG